MLCAQVRHPEVQPALDCVCRRSSCCYRFLERRDDPSGWGCFSLLLGRPGTWKGTQRTHWDAVRISAVSAPGAQKCFRISGIARSRAGRLGLKPSGSNHRVQLAADIPVPLGSSPRLETALPFASKNTWQSGQKSAPANLCRDR